MAIDGTYIMAYYAMVPILNIASKSYGQMLH